MKKYTTSAVFSAAFSTILSAAFISMNVCGQLFAADPTTGLIGEYRFTSPPPGSPATVTRFDQTVDFISNGSVSPIAGYPSSYYTISWSGAVTAPQTGTYTFYMTVDDCARLWVGKNWILERLSISGGAATTVQGTAALTAGQKSPLFLRMWQMPGAAQAKLEWSGPGVTRQVIPATALSPTGWGRIDATTASYESPASAIAFVRSGTNPPVNVSPSGQLVGPVRTVGDLAKVAEVRLLPTAPVTVSMPEGTATISKALTWKPIDFNATLPAEIVVRVNAEILVRPQAGQVPWISQPYAPNRNLTSIGSGLYKTQIPTPGKYVVGSGSATVDVMVLGLDIPTEFTGSIIQTDIAYGTIAPVPLIPGDLHSLVTYGSLDPALKVTRNPSLARESFVQSFSTVNQQWSYVRVGETGSLLALAPVRGYATAFSDAHQETLNPDGSKICWATMTVYPYVKNISFNLSMRAHTAKFLGGASVMTIATDGTASSLGEPGFRSATLTDGRVVGTFEFKVLFPAGETKWCLNAVGDQIAK